MSESLRERLARLDSCALSDALDRVGLSGVARGFRRFGPRRRVVGRAVTVLIVPGPGSGSRHLGTRALARARSDTVVVVDNGGRTNAGSWGGLLTLEGHVRGVAGVVVDGALRDADEIDELNVPMLARGTSPLSARGRFHEAATDVRVSLGGLSVVPDDWVVADGTGLVLLAADSAELVAGVAEEIVARESEMAEALRSGGDAQTILGTSYERLTARGGHAP